MANRFLSLPHEKPGPSAGKYLLRKCSEHPGRFDHIDRTNYHKYITDLIGIRVFFLVREDWIYFHNYITTVFENDPENYVEDRIQDSD